MLNPDILNERIAIFSTLNSVPYFKIKILSDPTPRKQAGVRDHSPIQSNLRFETKITIL